MLVNINPRASLTLTMSFTASIKKGSQSEPLYLFCSADTFLNQHRALAIEAGCSGELVHMVAAV